jgi:hypothetical protein
MPAISEDARAIRRMDNEELSGQLAQSIEFPEGLVDNDAAANRVLAILRQAWSESDTRTRGLVVNFTQRILDEMGLEVVRKNG